MKCLLGVCLSIVVLVSVPLATAQSAPEVPLQRGISVDMATASHAVPVPLADKEDALVVAVARNGDVFLGTTRIDVDALAEKVREAASGRADKTLYIKADARVAYAAVVKVLDAVGTGGVERITLLVAQRDSEVRAFPVSPKGLELKVERRAGIR